METFFAIHSYPSDPIGRGRKLASTKSRAEILKNYAVNNNADDRVPFVTTFHPRYFPLQDWTVCCTCPHVNSSSTIRTPKGHVNITGHFSCITDNVVCCATNVCRQCTLRPTTLESTAETSLFEGMTFLYLLTSTKPIIH